MSEVKKLEKLLQKHIDLYYNGEPELTDEEFDALEDKLRKLDPKNKLLLSVGQDSNGDFKKAEHIIPMNSLAKVNTEAAFRKWAESRDIEDMVLQYKFDGISLELQYKNGYLTKAVTRGDGKVGDDVSRNVKRMKDVPLKLPSDFTGAVRGEAILHRKEFEKYYQSKGMKNPRNTTSGLVKSSDGKGCEHLHLYAYDVIDSTNTNDFGIETNKLDFLINSGFNCNLWFDMTTTESSVDEVCLAYSRVDKEERHKLPYDIDGIVVKNAYVDWTDARREKPKKQIAFKFPTRSQVTTLLDVQWQQSGSIYTPVAILEPVEIDGSTVTKASLANPNLIEELGLVKGATVSVSKRGEIIPKVEKVIDVPDDAEPIELPSECFTCGEELNNKGTQLCCENKECGKLVHHSISTWIKVHDIKEFGKKLIEALYENKLTSSISDLYTLDVETLSSVKMNGKRLGSSNAQKAYDNLHSLDVVSLSRFIAGLDIQGISEKAIDLCVKAGFDTIEKLQSASVDEIESIKGLGKKKAKMIVDGIKERKKEIKKILKHISIEEPSSSDDDDSDDESSDEKSTSSKPLKGLSFCFTGALSCPRKELEMKVKKAGGDTKSSVTKGLTYLVADDPDSGTGKNKKARDLGVKVISEEEFNELLE